MPLNQTSIHTSAQGRQLAQRRWQAAASVPAASSSPTEILNTPPDASIVRAAALAGIAGFAAFIFCEWIRRQLLQSAGTQSNQPLQDSSIGILGKSQQVAVSASGWGWSVLIALAVAIWVFASQL